MDDPLILTTTVLRGVDDSQQRGGGRADDQDASPLQERGTPDPLPADPL